MTAVPAATPRTGGVVAVHAHPDDETLTSGALLATWAAAGLPATVVTCTRGEQGEVIGAAHARLEGDAAGLAAHREGEVADAAAALGVAQVFLDRLPAGGPAAGDDARYADSGMAWAGTGRAAAAAEVPRDAFVAVPLDEAAGRLAGLLRRRRPAVLATYEPGGGYGHPDHVRAHAVAQRAVELAADPAWAGPEPTGTGAAPWRVPAVVWAVVPADRLRAGYRALAADPVVAELLAATADPARGATREGPLVLPDPGGPLPSVAAPDDGPLPGLAVDVRPVRDRLLAALRAHATQVQAVRALGTPPLAGCHALSNLVLAPVLDAETYRWAPGSRPEAVAWPRGARPVADLRAS